MVFLFATPLLSLCSSLEHLLFMLFLSLSDPHPSSSLFAPLLNPFFSLFLFSLLLFFSISPFLKSQIPPLLASLLTISLIQFLIQYLKITTLSACQPAISNSPHHFHFHFHFHLYSGRFLFFLSITALSYPLPSLASSLYYFFSPLDFFIEPFLFFPLYSTLLLLILPIFGLVYASSCSSIHSHPFNLRLVQVQFPP